MRCRALAVVATTFFLVACSTVFAQEVFELSGHVDPNSTATDFDITPAPNGDIEFFAVPPNGSALLSVETIAPNLFLARLDFSLENGDPAWAEFMLFGDTGDHFIVATSTNFSSNSAFSDNFVLGGPGWIPQDAIYVVDSGGTIHIPTDHEGFIDVIEGIKANGNTITTLIIKGHGCGDPPLICLGPDAVLTCFGGTIEVTPIAGGSSIDITDTMNDICDENTVIRFRGCFTKPLADNVEDALGGEPDVKGAIRFVIGIPWTRWGIGVYR